MPKHAATDATEIDLPEHPAVKAWNALRPGRVSATNIETLKKRSRSTVYRIEGLGEEGSAVIAKRCVASAAVVERRIYDNVLPLLSIPVLRYYGSVEETNGEFSWLFLEDAGDQEYSPLIEEHRAAAARWLGLMHTSAVSIPEHDHLPDRGPAHYLAHMRSAHNRIERRLAHAALSADDTAVLKSIVSQCGALELRWSEVDKLCQGVSRSLVHGDFVTKNVRVRTIQDKVTVLPFDWHAAGWGIPAADLGQSALPGGTAKPDAATYWEVVRDEWPRLDLQTIERLTSVGQLFWCLACVGKDAEGLVYEGTHRCIRKLTAYQAELARIIETAQWIV